MIIQAMPYPAAGGGSALSYKTAEGLSAVAIATTDTTSATLSLSPSEQSVGDTYLGIWGLERTATSSSIQNHILLKLNGSTLEAQRFLRQESSPSDRAVHGGLFFHTGSASSDSYTIEGRVDSATASNAVNSRISILKLGPNDVHAEDLTGITTSSTSMVDALSVSVPAGGYNWLVVASAHLSGSAVTNRIELTDGTTTTGEILAGNARGQPGSPGAPAMVMLYLPGYSGGTVKVRTRCGTGTITTDRIRLVALRLDRFAGANVTVLGSNNAGTDATYTDALTQTFTPAAAERLFMGCGWLDGSSVTISLQAKLVDDATDVTETVREVVSASTPVFGHRIATYAASSRTQKIQRLSETTGATTTLKAKAVLASLDLTGI